MKRTVVSVMFVFTVAWVLPAMSQTFFIQGEKGLPGDASPINCSGNDCTTSKNVTMSGAFVASGAVALPDCPSGYDHDGTRTDIVLCKRGLDEMVKVGDFWIDRYEGIVVDEVGWNDGRCDGLGITYGTTSDNWASISSMFPFTGNWTAKLFSCSKSGVNPSGYLTWFQAQQALALSEKRLCTNEEWQAAVAGTFDPGVVDGTTGGSCHTSGPAKRATGKAGSTPRASNSCISAWGAEDMIGNLYELVAWWGQAGIDTGIAQGSYSGTVGSVKGWDGFSPETTGDGDGTWNINGSAVGCDRNGLSCVWKSGLPFAALRGGSWTGGTMAGGFTMKLSHAPSDRNESVGLRGCRR